MSVSIDRLMEEARRRFESFGLRQGRTLKDAWTGLGFPSEYKSVVEAGLMTPVGGKTTPRVLNWYRLTPKGVDEYRRRFPGSEDGTSLKY